MVSEYEAAKLRRDMEKELDAPSGIVVKCAVGIVVVVTLALISPTLGLEGDNSAQTVASKAAAR